MELSTTRPSRIRAILVATWRPMAIIGVAIGLAVGVVAFSRSGVFHVRHIEVAGNARLTRAEIVRLSGITQEANAVWLDESLAEDRIHESGWIRAVEVTVRLPWTVRVTVEERAPVAVATRGGNRVLVAGDGTVLGVAVRNEGLPIIEAPPPQLDSIGGASLSGPAQAVDALPARLRAGVRRVIVSPGATVELVLDDGVRVAFGSATDLRAKAEALTAVLEWAQRTEEELRRIDVSAPSAPAVVLAG